MPASRQPAGPYPNLHAGAPANLGGPAESFYTGEPQQDYGRPGAQPTYPQHSQPQYAGYDRPVSVAGAPHQYPPQRQDSWRASAPPGQLQQQYAVQPNYPPSEVATPQTSHLSLPNAPESVGNTPTSDPNASFYFNQPGQIPQAGPSAPSEVAPSPYPNLPQQYTQQPETPGSAAPSQAAAQQPPQPPQPQQPQQQQASAPPPQPQAPYWQHPAAQHVQVPTSSAAPWQQQPQQQNRQAYPGYRQEAFPQAPQHALQQPVVGSAHEEALIEL